MKLGKKSSYLGVKLTPELKALLVTCAARREVSAGWLARKYIVEGLRRETKGKAT